MKHLLLPTILFLNISGTIGAQPLSISNITITPAADSCDTGKSSVQLTATGGQPGQGGIYSYFDNSLLDKPTIATTATFDFTDDAIFFVADSAQNVIILELSAGPSKMKAVSIDILALPLGDGVGCIEVSALKASGLARGSVVFRAFNLDGIFFEKTIDNGPFKVVIPALPNNQLSLEVAVNDDCKPGTITRFAIQFTFPKGISNPLKAYLFNNYCGCGVPMPQAR